MKFGSRMDVFVPVTAAEPRARTGDVGACAASAHGSPAAGRRADSDGKAGGRRRGTEEPTVPARRLPAAQPVHRGQHVLRLRVHCVLDAGRLVEPAAPFIGIAIVLDMLDGRIARLTNTTSAFGVEFDSLADVISFGAAPAVLAFAWGLSGARAASAGPRASSS